MNRRRTAKRAHPLYYTQRWRMLRKHILARDGYRCVVCHAPVGSTGAARIDHIERLADNPARAFDPTNLRTLCTTCDAQGHAERGPGRDSRARMERFNFGFDESGMPKDPKHQWLVKG